MYNIQNKTLARRRAFQGILNIAPQQSREWIASNGVKVFLVKEGHAGNSLWLKVEKEIEEWPNWDQKDLKVVETKVDLRYGFGVYRVTVGNGTNLPSSAYFHLEDNRTGLCIFNTIVCNKLGKNNGCKELETLRLWRDEYLEKSKYGQLLVDHYYEVAEVLAPTLSALDDSQFFETLYSEYIRSMLESIANGNHSAVISAQQNMLRTIEERLDAFKLDVAKS